MGCDMKILKTLALAGTMAMMAGTSFAATVKAEHKGTSGRTDITYTYNGTTTKNASAGQFAMKGSNTTIGNLTGDFVAFCVDLAQTIKSPTTYTIKNDLFNTTIAGKIQNLFDSSYKTDLTQNQNAAFQIALWETIYGKNFSSSSLSSTVNGFLNAANNWDNNTPKIWDLTFLYGHGTNPKSQNLVAVDKAPQPAPVPLPAAGFLLLGGLGGLGIVARRRTNAA